MKTPIALAAVLAVFVAGGGCTRKPDQTHPIPTLGTPAAVQVQYGTSHTITTGAGAVKLTADNPEVVRLHPASYAPEAPDGKTPGPEDEPMVRVLVTVDGVSGQVPPVEAVTAGSVYLSYLAGGVEIDDTAPLMTYEDTKMLSDQPNVVAAGGHTSGYLYFKSADGSGQLAATLAGIPNAQPIVLWHE